MTEPKLIKGLNAEYLPAVWDGNNTSGIRCVGTSVLVLMDLASEKTSGGIITPDFSVEKATLSSETGVVVHIADGAFRLNEDMSPWSGDKPSLGDRVFVERYAGKQIPGRDGRTYRLMDYKCIGGVYEPEEKAAKAA